MDLKVGYICDRGLNPRRPVNQDRFLAIPEKGLFAVFDGVGGQRAGEVVSQTAAETIEEAFSHQPAGGASVDVIRRAIDFANRDIFEMAENDPALKTMATTIALIHLEGSRVIVAHVGDSRVYRLEEGRFHRETVDHTDLNDEIRAGRASRDQESELAGRNIINRALGVESGVEVEIKSIDAREGTRFLLCSDGIYRHLSDEEIARVLAEHKDPQKAADELKRIVHQRGAEDNLTAVIVQMGRVRQTPIISIDDGIPGLLDKAPANASVSGNLRPERGGRIKVDFNRERPVLDESTSPLDARNRMSETYGPGRRRSGLRVLMYSLLVLVLIAGAFYGGLRAPDYFNKGESNQNPNGGVDPLQAGREAFEKGEYRIALAEFESLSKRDPSNVRGLYWLGRAQLELREYASAAKSFEDVTTRQPLMYDAYVQQAAVYELMGDKTRAAAALSRYVEERRKNDH